MGLGLLKPKHTIPGGDIAGQVEAVGRNVKHFQPGDEVFGDIGGIGHGPFAEYVSLPENVLALKPVNLSYEEAAAFPQYALVARARIDFSSLVCSRKPKCPTCFVNNYYPYYFSNKF